MSTVLVRRIVASGLLALLLAVATASVSAHHSFAAFNMTEEKTITGKVKTVEWTNPHIWIWVDVANAGGGTDTYGFEGMSPNFLERRGWKRTTLKTGDTVTITFRPLVDGKNGGMFTTGKMEDGTVLSMGGAR
jgi:hypothetical protein